MACIGDRSRAGKLNGFLYVAVSESVISSMWLTAGRDQVQLTRQCVMCCENMDACLSGHVFMHMVALWSARGQLCARGRCIGGLRYSWPDHQSVVISAAHYTVPHGYTNPVHCASFSCQGQKLGTHVCHKSLLTWRIK